MNARQRFLETLRFGNPDRVPYHDREIPDDVVEGWHKQGLPGGVSPQEYFELDRWELIGPREEPRLNIATVPDFLGPLRSPADFGRLRRTYDPGSPGRYPGNWNELVERWRGRDYPVGITVWRGMLLSLGVRDWDSLRDVMYAIYDLPEQLDEVMQHVTEFTVATIDQALRQVQFDYAVLAEPIASWHAPVVGPRVYRRYVVPVLRRIIERLRAAQVEIIILDTHGAVNPILPAALEAGVNTLWLGSARAAGINYLELRRELGRALRLIGGLDVRALRQDKRAIEQEIMSLAPALLEQGLYIPMVDERIRSPVSFENYAWYRHLIRKLVEGK
jgi:hypothetical protein